VWALNSGDPNKESSKLLPKNKILAHVEGRCGTNRIFTWSPNWIFFRYALCCKFSPDSSLLVTTSADRTAKLWRTSDFTLVQVTYAAQMLLIQVLLLQTLTMPEEAGPGPQQPAWVWDAAFTADSQMLLTASSSDHKARLWNIKTAEVMGIDGGQIRS
jgi:G protein beta subunit-like protein